MKRGVLWLVVLIPFTSVLVGALILYLALANPDVEVEQSLAPMSKTSWQNELEQSSDER